MTAPVLYFGNLPRFTEPALCAETDPDVWFPEKGGSAVLAKATCRACPAQNECLAYALKHDIRFGVWGGKSQKERKKLRPGTTGRPAQRPPCGTERGAAAHRRRLEKACDRCRIGERDARAARALRRTS